MSSVSALTIPESAYDPSYFLNPQNRRKSKLFLFLIRLCNASAIALTIAYIIGFFGLKPLLELNRSRHHEVYQKLRGKLRDCYLNLLGRVSEIPIVICKREGRTNKYYADAICQTPHSYMKKTEEEIEEERIRKDKFYHERMLNKLNTLNDSLNKCTSYQTSEIPHYDLSLNSIKDLHNKSDTEYFNVDEMFSILSPETNNKIHQANELKREIRNIKGMYMSGQI